MEFVDASEDIDPARTLATLHGPTWRAEAYLLARQGGLSPALARQFAQDPTGWYHREDIDGVPQWTRFPALAQLVERADWQLEAQDDAPPATGALGDARGTIAAMARAPT